MICLKLWKFLMAVLQLQIGKSIRLFVIDASPMEEDEPSLTGFRKVFINAKITEETGGSGFLEGCLDLEIRERGGEHLRQL